MFTNIYLINHNINRINNSPVIIVTLLFSYFSQKRARNSFGYFDRKLMYNGHIKKKKLFLDFIHCIKITKEKEK